jgi:hypothetical protein
LAQGRAGGPAHRSLENSFHSFLPHSCGLVDAVNSFITMPLAAL